MHACLTIIVCTTPGCLFCTILVQLLQNLVCYYAATFGAIGGKAPLPVFTSVTDHIEPIRVTETRCSFRVPSGCTTNSAQFSLAFTLPALCNAARNSSRPATATFCNLYTGKSLPDGNGGVSHG